MKPSVLYSFSAVIAAFLLFFTPVSQAKQLPEAGEALTFTVEDQATAVAIVRSLERNHYSGQRLNNAVSSRIFDQYLTMLDPGRILFTQSDIDGFEPFRYRFDNDLKRGNIAPAYGIFKRFMERSRQRLVSFTTLADTWKTTLDFTTDETIDLVRKEMPWPSDEKTLEHLWKNEFLNVVLNLKLEDETDEAISETVTKRYASRLNHLDQTNSADCFRTYMNAVTMSFDPHTQYFPPRLSEDFDIQMSLSLEGIGAVLQSEYEYTKVVSLIAAGPAEKSHNLMPGDKIIGVGQNLTGEIQDVVGWRIDEVVKLIRGPKDTVVRLKIIPAEKKGLQSAKVVNIKRDRVRLEEQAAKQSLATVNVNNRDYTIGTVEIPVFYQDFKGSQAGEKEYRSTTRDVRRLIDELKQENIDGLIIDLRNNGGGSLQEVNELVGLFIKTGPTVQVKGRNGFMSKLTDPDPSIVYTGPLIVMINRMSASASEIFAGAIKDYNRGILVGTRTFGKGTVQVLQSINNGQLKLTNAKFYRISGKSTQNRGVSPDIFYPMLYNPEDIGESALDGALPWDMSQRAEFTPYRDLAPAIEKLGQAHEQRIISNPEFAYLRERYDLTTQIYNVREWSLNETKRRLEKEQFKTTELAIENRLRASRNLPPLESLEQKETRTKDIDPEKDILLKETELIMVDFIDFSKNQGLIW